MNKIEKYPDVIEISEKKREYSSDYILPEEWHVYQYKFIKDYFLKTLSGWSVADFFPNIPIAKIALYAITDFTDFVIGDLKRKYDSPIILSDKHADKFENGHNGIRVYTQQELYEKYKRNFVNKVIVCNFFHANEIMQELMNLGFKLNDIITITTVMVDNRKIR